jgi:hypothetical protein
MSDLRGSAEEQVNWWATTLDALRTENAVLRKERSIDAILKNSADKLTGGLWEKIAEQEKEIAALRAELARARELLGGD